MSVTEPTSHPERSSLNDLYENRLDMSVIYDVHQLPIGHPQDEPMAHEELVEQRWLMYESTALWRAVLLVKHGLAVDGLEVIGLGVNGLAVVVGFGVNGLAVDGSVVNGFAVAGLGVNGLAVDGLKVNGLAVAGLGVDGLAVVGLPVNGLLERLAVGGEHVVAAQEGDVLDKFGVVL